MKLTISEDDTQSVRDICKELETSHVTVMKAVRKFRRLLHAELVKNGTIENKEYCR